MYYQCENPFPVGKDFVTADGRSAASRLGKSGLSISLVAACRAAYICVHLRLKVLLAAMPRQVYMPRLLRSRFRIPLAPVIGALCLFFPAPAALSQVPISGAQSADLQVQGDRQWTDSGIDLKAGETLRIEAKGTLQYANAPANGPEGLKRGWMDVVRILPLNDAGRGALIGRIGEDSAARPFLIGPRRESRGAVPGRLFLGINQQEGEKAEGSFAVHIERTTSAAAPVEQAAIERMPHLTQAMLDQVPARVVDAEGNQGDRTNFIIVGSEEQVRGALEAAGWVKVDSTVKDTILRGALATFSKQAYVTVPMSQLMLFGRIQDFGFAQADPVRVITSRHHFRLWKAPFTLAGRDVWVGAGTHDIGIERDQRNGKFTHKIDPQVDVEREYIGRSLYEGGQVAKLDYMMPANPVKEAKTATGGGFSSDGRTLIVYLQPESLLRVVIKDKDIESPKP
jgi:hypothetical protein